MNNADEWQNVIFMKEEQQKGPKLMISLIKYQSLLLVLVNITKCVFHADVAGIVMLQVNEHYLQAFNIAYNHMINSVKASSMPTSTINEPRGCLELNFQTTVVRVSTLSCLCLDLAANLALGFAHSVNFQLESTFCDQYQPEICHTERLLLCRMLKGGVTKRGKSNFIFCFSMHIFG